MLKLTGIVGVVLVLAGAPAAGAPSRSSLEQVREPKEGVRYVIGTLLTGPCTPATPLGTPYEGREERSHRFSQFSGGADGVTIRPTEGEDGAESGPCQVFPQRLRAPRSGGNAFHALRSGDWSMQTETVTKAYECGGCTNNDAPHR